MFSKTLAAALVLAATAVTALPAAAQQFSLGLSATNEEEANLIRGGLVLFQIANGADPLQTLQRAATGSVGVIHQEGNGHNGSLAQNGNAAGGLFQFGNNTNASVTQAHGDADLVFVFGW